MRRPRGLSREEAELWSRVARTVTPLRKLPPRNGAAEQPQAGGADSAPAQAAQGRAKPVIPSTGFASPPPRSPEPAKPRPLDRHGLDGSWERKLSRAEVHPDFTLDLHGHGLDAAHSRLDHGLSQAVALGARVVLVITGRPRPVEAADRGERRGAIRAKLLDWLAHGTHAHRIAAVRGAHRKHGGAGAVYVILKRPR
ncbi:MAG: Smr/MutS family protein [Sphingomonadales bacterium]|nr:Smr/MutS family protein [Sphingomonadales bacterium]